MLIIVLVTKKLTRFANTLYVPLKRKSMDGFGNVQIRMLVYTSKFYHIKQKL